MLRLMTSPECARRILFFECVTFFFGVAKKMACANKDSNAATNVVLRPILRHPSSPQCPSPNCWLFVEESR